MKTLNLFDLNLVNDTQENAINALLSVEGKTTAAFVNAHCINEAAKNPIYKDSLRTADFVLPDGTGIAIAAKMAGHKVKENLNGTDLFLPLCKAAAAQGKSVFFLGSAPGVARKASQEALYAVPGLKIAGTHHGYFGMDETLDVIDEINASKPDILLVALGVPTQDVWINTYRHMIDAPLAMGVGAMFDFHASVVSRAPQALRSIGQEWMWRLAVEPKRMAGRYLLGNPMFMLRAWKNAREAKRIVTRGKRILDVTVASLALIALSPVFLFAALSVKMTSKGPVFFHQKRVGYKGAEFGMIKFRSMYIDAEARREALLKTSDRQGVCFKQKNDPRITRVGRFIRRFSIDELPQLLNVLKGEMSLVGPRPALPSEVAQYSDYAMARLQAVPGITGIWQVSGRAEIGFDQMVEMDIAYSKSTSLGLDFILLALTARAVFSGHGAY